MAKKSRAGRREIAKAWRVWRARFCAQRFKREYYGVDPARLRAMKRKLTISAARNAKRNSPRVGVTPVNPEEERPRPQISSSAHVSSVVLDSVTCPIMQALVVRPAVAEDGKIYEYDAIKRWVRDNHRSPVTNASMEDTLVVYGGRNEGGVVGTGRRVVSQVAAGVQPSGSVA